MKKIFMLSCLALLLGVSLMGKYKRYDQRPNNMENHVALKMNSWMRHNGFVIQGIRTLTANGAFVSYTYTHTACTRPVTITPFFQGNEAVSMVSHQQASLYYYATYTGYTFPSWRYTFYEALSPLRQLFDKSTVVFPTVLSIYDPSDCLQQHNLKPSQLWEVDFL